MSTRANIVRILFTAVLLTSVVVLARSSSAQTPVFSNIRVVIGADGTTAHITWDGTRTTCGTINYGTVFGGLTLQKAQNSPCTTSPFSADLSGLSPNTRYYYEVVNTTSPAVGSGQKAFNTGAPTAPAISTITAHGATFTFDTTFPACGTIVYGQNAATLASTGYTASEASCVCDGTSQAGCHTGSHTVVLTDADPQKQYYYASSTTPWGLLSSQANFTTLPLLANTNGSGGSPVVTPPGPVGPLTSTIAAFTAVNIVSTTTSGATLSFSYTSSVPASTLRYQTIYGQTGSYGSKKTAELLDPQSGSKSIDLSGLNPGTTYHFAIQLINSNDDVVLTTADRTFTTARGGSDTTTLIAEKIRVDCVDSSCTVYFSTNQSAHVEVRWGPETLAATTPFASYPDSRAETTDATGMRSLIIPVSPATFAANSTHRYRLQANGASGAQFTTGQLSFTTSASASDHVFATGQCSDGGTPATLVDIGSCLGSRYCRAAGDLAEDCTKCGFVCPNGKTCRTGALGATCEADVPITTGSASQCNVSSCYNASGDLLTPTPARCYSTWPRCNANTILKVRKDRGCNVWLTCATSLQVEGTNGQAGENMCLSLTACNSLNTKGQCNHYLPLGQCNNDPTRFCSTDVDCVAGGTCNNPDPTAPTRSLQTMTFQSPIDVAKISDLSGNVVAGLDWGQQGGANVIQGQLPWQLMRQIGGDAQIKNGDFEYQAPSATPWVTVPSQTPHDSIKVEFEDRDSGPNHVLKVEPVTETTPIKLCQDTTVTTNPKILSACNSDSDCRPTGNTSAVCVVSGKCTDTVVNAKTNSDCTLDSQCRPTGNTTAKCVASNLVNYSGAASNAFSASPSEYYYAEARIRADGGSPVIRMQFGHSGYAKFTVTDGSGTTAVTTPTYVDIPTTSAWQRVTLGPIRGMSGQTQLAFVCSDRASCGKFEIDDVIVKPVLQVDNNPSYITPSCRLYPKNDSPSCDYADSNGVIYKGWKGYCLEHDSQTGTCLSWWPVDIIKGESSIFGTEKAAGYQDRSPLYLCAETKGVANNPDPICGTTTFSGAANGCVMVQDNGDWGRSGGYASPYWGKAVGNIQVGTTRFRSVNSDANKGCGDDVENVGSERGFVVCDHNPQTWNIGVTAEDAAMNKQDLDHIIIAPQRVDNRFGMPELVLDAANGWSQSWDGGDRNFTKVTANWDANGYLSSWTVRLDPGSSDNNNDSTGYWGAVLFVKKEICTKLVQVVEPNGNASAFASRVGSSVYKVPDLGYGLTSDLAPFGGALAPITGGNDPTDWGLLEAQQPDYQNRQPPGQARSGSPYACNGNCTDVVCSADNTSCLDSNGNVDQTKVAQCQQKDIDSDGSPDGQCVGVIGKNASSKSTQMFTAAQCINGFCSNGSTGNCSAPLTGQTCSATKNVSGFGLTHASAISAARNACGIKADGTGSIVACNGNIGKCVGTQAYYDTYIETSYNSLFRVSTGRCAVSATQRYTRGVVGASGSIACTTNNDCQVAITSDTFFAQERIKRLFAESFGVWTDLRCSNNAAKVCMVDGDCGTGNKCNLEANAYAAVPNSTSSNATSDADFVGWKPPADICRVNPAYKANTCTSSVLSCTASVQVTGVSTATGSEDARRQAAMADALAKCGLSYTGTIPVAAGAVIKADPVKTCTDTVTTNTRIGQTCTTDASCRPTGNTTALCMPTKTACTGVSNECPGQAGVYDAGTNVPFTTFTLGNPCSLASNGQFSCVGRCTSDLSYVNAGKPTGSVQSKYIRPAYVSGSTADYCAIPPEVTNAKFVTGAATISTIIGGSGSVGIKFNTNADVEQVPLKEIRIDWGDSQDVFGYPYAPRNDPAKPHIFSHTYVLNRGDANNCKTVNGRTICQFAIKIQVVDSWNWCNDAVDNNAAPDLKCHTDKLGNDRYDTTNWYDTGLRVVVQP